MKVAMGTTFIVAGGNPNTLAHSYSPVNADKTTTYSN